MRRLAWELLVALAVVVALSTWYMKRARSGAPGDGPAAVHQVNLVRFAHAARDRVHADEVPDPLKVLGVAEDSHGCPDATARRRSQSNTARDCRSWGNVAARAGARCGRDETRGSQQREASSLPR